RRPRVPQVSQFKKYLMFTWITASFPAERKEVMQATVATLSALDIWKGQLSGSGPDVRSAQIDKREKLSRKEFLHEYVRKNRPVVITDAVREWKALSKWTPKFFADTYGDRKVPVFERKRAVTMKDSVLLGDYIEEITSSTFNNRAKYLFSLKIP